MEGRPLGDEELARRAKEGDLDAFESLVRIHQQAAHRLAYVITGSAPEAADTTQEALVKAYSSLDRFREGAPFRPWLLRIVANEAKNRRRSQSRRSRREMTLREHRGSGDAAPSPESAVLASEERELLLGAVNRLPEKLRVVVACSYFLGLSEAEAATVLSIPQGTVKSRLSRALSRLRRDVGLAEPPSEGQGHRG
ncbi:MAG: RNA polymerase sigma factor [Acidimicrobiia bacterium]